MEGPTPVSALLHSATLITAGTILGYKFQPLLEHTPDVILIIILLAVLSSILNSLCSLDYFDIKRIVAYSTAVHTSLMIFAIFLTVSSLDTTQSSYDFSMLHLFAHGWIKSLIFMLVGYFIAYIHTQDIRTGGTISYLPMFSFLFICSLLIILGFPGSSISNTKDIIFDFGYISIYGSTLLYPILALFFFAQGYALSMALYTHLTSTGLSLSGFARHHYSR